MKKLLSSDGWTMLELAVAIPALLMGGVAIVDIGRTFQGKTALKAATEAALNCMATAEGRCVVDAARTQTSAAEYSVETTEETPILSIPLIHYHGTASITEAPTYLLSKKVQKVVGIKEEIQRPYREQVETYRYPTALRLEGYVRETVHISGDSPRNPEFTDDEGDSFNPQFNTSYTILVKEHDVASIQIKIPTYSTPPRTENCILYSSERDTSPTPCGKFPWNPGDIMGNTSHPWSVPNTSNRNEFTDITYAVLYIEGSSSGTHRDVEAKTLLTLSRAETSEQLPSSLDLGGQYFKGASSNSNFYPRGAHTSWVSGPITSYTNGELPYEMAHYQAIAVRPGETITLSFSVKREPDSPRKGALQWGLRTVKIFLPRYKKVSPTIACNVTSSCDGICHLSHFGLEDRALTKLTSTQSEGPCVSSSRAATSEVNNGSCVTKTYVDDVAESCPPTTAQSIVPCTSDAYLEHDVSATTLAHRCGINTPVHSLSSVQSETALLSTTFSPKNCSELPPQEPEPWRNFVGDFTSRVLHSKFIPYQETTCSEFKTKNISFDTCKEDAERGIQGLFTIPQRQEATLLIERLTQEAVACGMPQNSKLDISFTVTGQRETIPLTSSDIPTQYEQYASTVTLRSSTVSLGTYPLGELPEICKTNHCTKKEVTSEPPSQIHSAFVNESLAYRVAADTLKTYLPNVTIAKNCTGKRDCFEITINAAEEPLSVAIKGSTTAITPGLGFNSYPLHYTQQQYSERYRPE